MAYAHIYTNARELSDSDKRTQGPERVVQEECHGTPRCELHALAWPSALYHRAAAGPVSGSGATRDHKRLHGQMCRGREVLGYLTYGARCKVYKV